MSAQLMFAAMQTLITLALTGITGYLVAMLKAHGNGRREEAEKQEGIKKAVMVILQMIICDMHDRYLELGYIPKEAYERFNNVYEIYHDCLGGNGLGSKMKEEIEQLPVK